MWFKLVYYIIFIYTIEAKEGFGPGKQEYGFVDVRPGAHMFWWLFYTTANVTDSYDRPLILWIEGGPGSSGSGYGNFELIGPLDANLKPRNYTWVNDFNVLFVDNPVGTGFSYLDDPDLHCKNNSQIASDLLTFMKSFYEKFPKFEKTPFYIFGHSYGGKMSIEFVRLLYEEVKSGSIRSNIMGVSMGNPWISPIDTMYSYGSFLYGMSLIDDKGKELIDNQIKNLEGLINNGSSYDPVAVVVDNEITIFEQTDGVDFYNVLFKVKGGENTNLRHFMDRVYNIETKEFEESNQSIDNLMDDVVRKSLKIPEDISWEKMYTSDVITNLSSDFIISVADIVESILNETNIKVHVFNGNIDFICNTPGQLAWINKLNWSGATEFKNIRKTIWVNDVMQGYEKTGGNFAFFAVNHAGHNVPTDNPEAMRYILKSMTGV